MSRFVEALNTQTGKPQVVPEHYVGNPNIFGGAFVPPAAANKRSKKSRRQAGTAENTPAPAAEATTNPAPDAGELEKE